MSVEIHDFNGDVAVERNLMAGGDATIEGDALVKHNLKVEGWLDAVNIKGPNKGLFMTWDDLIAAYPSPLEGWFAAVGTSTPFDVYVGYQGQWTATGGHMYIDIDPSQYPTIEGAVLQEHINEVNAALTNEINIRSREVTAIGQQVRPLLFVNAIAYLYGSAADTYLRYMPIAQVLDAIAQTSAERRGVVMIPGVVLTFRSEPDRWQTWQWVGREWNNLLHWVKIHDCQMTRLRERITVENGTPEAVRVAGDATTIDSITLDGVRVGATEFMMLSPGTHNIAMMLATDLTVSQLPDDLLTGCEMEQLVLPSGLAALDLTNQSSAKIESVVVPETVANIVDGALSTTLTTSLTLTGLPPTLEDKTDLYTLNRLVLPAQYIMEYQNNADWLDVIQAIQLNSGRVALSDGTTYGAEAEVSLCFIYTQAEPATTWTIGHKLNRYPSVTVTDTAGTMLIGEVTYTDANSLTITFEDAISGRALLN